MSALSAHLRQPDDHGTLPFHPGCPLCNEARRHGALGSAALVSPRTQAALAVGVLAMTSASPIAAVAAERDNERGGSAATAQTGGADSAQSPDFDPGGTSTDLPASPAPAPQQPAPPVAGNDDTGALDRPPATDADSQVIDNGDGASTNGNVTVQPPPPPPSPVQAPNAPAATPSQPPTAESAQPKAGVPSAAPTAAPPPDTPPSAAPRTDDDTSSAPARRRAAVAPVESAGTSEPSQRAASAPSTTAHRSATSARPPTPVGFEHAKPGDRSHTVQPGESLWSISSDLLGSGASPARIAREVHRLWELNKTAIATGDPDLLMIDTRLRLR